MASEEKPQIVVISTVTGNSYGHETSGSRFMEFVRQIKNAGGVCMEGRVYVPWHAIAEIECREQTSEEAEIFAKKSNLREAVR